ncbi:hypothetical protein B0T24DRAFT_685237 [Lasiosphaeria ovina]|uniref:Cell wall mannoprotein PIR1-like C-terminal domain-containing protein n=1 Tax=Lasiosphaeria ovina TaxID=92902 RepID=A0AAE0JSA2_9PEZI|nr:hypothetical protein B0T24DRAFT_685237 [Lasiosphaeria ovina]
MDTIDASWETYLDLSSTSSPDWFTVFHVQIPATENPLMDTIDASWETYLDLSSNSSPKMTYLDLSSTSSPDWFTVFHVQIPATEKPLMDTIDLSSNSSPKTGYPFRSFFGLPVEGQDHAATAQPAAASHAAAVGGQLPLFGTDDFAGVVIFDPDDFAGVVIFDPDDFAGLVIFDPDTGRYDLAQPLAFFNNEHLPLVGGAPVDAAAGRHLHGRLLQVRCGNGTLALGGSTVFYQCASGNFYNLYDGYWAAQCSPVEMLVMPCGGEDSAAGNAGAAGLCNKGSKGAREKAHTEFASACQN